MAIDDNKGSRNNPLYTHIIGNESSTWARESTLDALLNATGGTNSLLSEYIKKEYPNLAKKANDIADKGHKKAGAKLDDIDKSTKQSGKNIKDLEDELKDQNAKLRATLNSSINKISTVIKSDDPTKNIAEILKNGLETAGEGLGTAVGSIMGARGAEIGKAIGGTLGALTGELGVRGLKLNDMFRQLYDTGISLNGDMLNVATSAQGLGLTSEQATEFLKKHSQLTVSMGIPALTKFTQQLSKATTKGADLGYTYTELAEAGTEYADLMLQTHQMDKKTSAEMTQGAAAYLAELTGLAQLTGKTRQQLAQEQKDKAKDASFRAARSLLTSKADQERLDALNMIPGAMGQLMKKLFFFDKTGTYTLNKEEEQQWNTMSVDLRDQVMGSLRGVTEGLDFGTQNLKTSMEVFTDENIPELLKRGAVGQRGAESIAGAGKNAYEGSNDLYGLKLSLENYAKENKISFNDAIKKMFTPEQKQGTKDTTKTISDVNEKVALAKTTFDQFAGVFTTEVSTKIQQTITAMSNLGPIVEKLGSTINQSIEKMTGTPTGISDTTMGGAAAAAGLGAAGYGGATVAKRAVQVGLARSTTVQGLMNTAKGVVEPLSSYFGTAANTAGTATTEAAEATIAETAGKAAMKGIAKRIPAIGGLIAGGLEMYETGNIGRAVFAGAGSLAGGTLGAAGGSLVAPVAGTIAGGVAGSVAGEKGGTELYDYLFGGQAADQKKVSDAVGNINNSVSQIQASNQHVADAVAPLITAMPQVPISPTETAPNATAISQNDNLAQSIASLTSSNGTLLEGIGALNLSIGQMSERTVQYAQEFSAQSVQLQMYSDAIKVLASQNPQNISELTEEQYKFIADSGSQNIKEILREYIDNNMLAVNGQTDSIRSMFDAQQNRADDYDSMLERLALLKGEASRTDAGLQSIQAYAPIIANSIQAQLDNSAGLTAKQEEIDNTTSSTEQDILPAKQTKHFYDRSLYTSETMLGVMKELLDKINELNENLVDQTNSLDRSISRMSGVIH